MMPSDAWATSLKAAQANVLRSSQAQMEHLNEQLLALYLGRFANWKISVDAGKIDNRNPPKPPAAYVLETTSEGFAFPALGEEPVCAMPAIPPDRTQPQVLTITTGNARVQNVPPGDHYPVGFEVTAPDGVRWRKMASQTPFGLAYYYARVDELTPSEKLTAIWGT